MLLNLFPAIIAATLAANPPDPSWVPPPPLVFGQSGPLVEELPPITDRFKAYVWGGGCPAAMHTNTKEATLKVVEPCWWAFLPHA